MWQLLKQTHLVQVRDFKWKYCDTVHLWTNFFSSFIDFTCFTWLLKWQAVHIYLAIVNGFQNHVCISYICLFGQFSWMWTNSPTFFTLNSGKMYIQKTTNCISEISEMKRVTDVVKGLVFGGHTTLRGVVTLTGGFILRYCLDTHQKHVLRLTQMHEQHEFNTEQAHILKSNIFILYACQAFLFFFFREKTD